MFLGVVTCMFLGVVTCMFLGGIDLASVSMSFRLDFRTAVRVVMFASLFYFIRIFFFYLAFHHILYIPVIPVPRVLKVKQSSMHWFAAHQQNH